MTLILLLAAGQGSGSDVAVTLNRVPAVLDAAHIGILFTDVMGSDHSQVLRYATGHRPGRSGVGKFVAQA
jgi:hypothetical protein